MRVLLSPEAESLEDGPGLAELLAGPRGDVVRLGQRGVRTLRRPLSAAEVHYVRRALLGLSSGDELRPRPAGEVELGLVCGGRVAQEEEAVSGTRFAVSDHVNLAWRSPLRGPNDDSLGPRFPATVGLYRPGLVRESLGGQPVSEAIVACPKDDRAPTKFEAETIERHRFRVISTELAPMALLAAHLGYRLAAVVLDRGEE